MLNPNVRLLYLEELRPPEEYKLDRAIATTFSLDLLSLLMAPLSMVFSEQGNQDDLLKDPIAFLEAVQRTKDRLAVFCQAGRIIVPTVDSRLYSYLEPIVVEVQPPGGKGVFHPKIWLLRFVKPHAPVYYRLLCLSRNLTFDRSWDTVLALEGYLQEQRQLNFRLNRPLVDFIRALPTLAVSNRQSETGTTVRPEIQAHIDTMAAEVGRVQFQPPEGFDAISAFIPVGLNGYKKFLPLSDYNRLLILSPFLSDEWLTTSMKSGSNNVLISRSESLDDLNNKTLVGLEANTKMFIMDEAAEQADNPEGDVKLVDSSSGTELSGLHAKLYILEQGWRASVLTGSANATSAASNGTNIEFMVELSGMRSQVGIEQFLGGGDSQTTSLRSLLQPYQKPQTPPKIDPTKKRLETILDTARRVLVGAGLSLKVVPGAVDTFHLELKASQTPANSFGAIRGCCYPVSLNSSHARDIAPLMAGQVIGFNNLSLVSLTSFFVFGLTATLDGQQSTLGFVLNLPVEGMPAQRDKHILHSIISDRSLFIRYLLFLLTEEAGIFNPQEFIRPDKHGSNNGVHTSSIGLPLLEELVRASCRQPAKIDRIATLVDDLKQSEEGQALLPEGFDEIWQAFLALRTGGENL